MSLRYVASCGLVCAALVLSGCDDGRPAPGKVTVQITNVAPGFGSLSFQREQDTRQEWVAVLSFKGTSAFVYDADTYDFYVVEPTLNDNDPGRTWTFAPTLEPNTNYVFALTEVAGEIEPLIVGAPTPSAGSAQVVAAHAAVGLPAMDLYIQPVGVGIAGATPRGSFGPRQQIAPLTLSPGDYELFLTAAGNPANVLLASGSFGLPSGITSTFIVVDERGQGTAQLSVVLLQGGPTLLFDRNAPAELRVINGATDQAPRDVAINSQFSPPLFSAAPFGDTTAYAQTPLGSNPLQITPVGNPGVFELESNFSAVIGQRASLLFTGPPGALLGIYAADDGRRLNREAKLRVMNSALQFAAVDFVLTVRGGDPNTTPTLAQLFPPGVSSYLPVYPGDYDLYVYQANTTTVLAGPAPISVSAAGIYSVLAIDGPDTATVGLRFLDDFP